MAELVITGESVSLSLAVTGDLLSLGVSITDAPTILSLAVTEAVSSPSLTIGPDTLLLSLSVSDSAPLSWVALVTGAIPTGPVSITGGVVYTYDYGATIYYRFIATGGTVDSFYLNFDGTSLTGLVASKFLTF